MKKTLILLFTVIIVLSLLKIAAATTVAYDFCAAENETDTADNSNPFTFTGLYPGNPGVTVTSWSDNATPDDYPLVHKCYWGLGVISDPYYHTNGNKPTQHNDNHAVDAWAGNSEDKIPGQEKLIFTFDDEVTINSITFTRVDDLDDFALYVDDDDKGDFHIQDFINYTPTFDDFVLVNFSTGYTGTIFEISTIEGCDDFKVARMGDPIPEPGTIFLLFFGLLGMIGFKKKFKKM